MINTDESLVLSSLCKLKMDFVRGSLQRQIDSTCYHELPCLRCKQPIPDHTAETSMLSFHILFDQKISESYKCGDKKETSSPCEF